jgi:hypothetical protein
MKETEFLPSHFLWTVKHASAGGEQKFPATHWAGRQSIGVNSFHFPHRFLTFLSG